jgi:DNA-binding beta-propeller fold protein YncE
LVVALAGCGGGSDDEAAAPQPTGTGAPPSSKPVLAATGIPEGSRIHWVDGRTLEPVDPRSVEIPFYTATVERSPDGSSLAVGGSETGDVQLVDLEEMRTVGAVAVEGASHVERLNWVRPDLLLASLGGLTSQAAAIDPVSGRVVAAHDLGGTTLYSQSTEAAIVLLVAPSDRIGPARVVVFDGSEPRSVELAEVKAGWEQVEDSEDDYQARQSVPALAVDPAGTRALVIPAGNRVAEVDLETLTVAYHDLAEPVSLLGRLRDWLEPPAQAKAIDGPDRNAVWLRSGLVAVSGANYSYSEDDGDMDITPAGVALIDPSDWTVSRLSDEPSWVTLRGDSLLASAWTVGVDEQTLMVFDPDGTLRFSLAREGADLSQVSGDHLYVATHEGTRFEIVDLETGETVGRAQPKRETWLLQTDL